MIGAPILCTAVISGLDHPIKIALSWRNQCEARRNCTVAPIPAVRATRMVASVASLVSSHHRSLAAHSHSTHYATLWQIHSTPLSR